MDYDIRKKLRSIENDYQYRKALRYVNGAYQRGEYEPREDILPADRIVNRALYGTDYDPDEVAFGIKYRREKLMFHRGEPSCC